jgi:hypothetical protein
MKCCRQLRTSNDKVVIVVRIPFTFLLICYVFVLICCGSVHANQRITIDVKSDEVIVSSGEVTLGDIARISGSDPVARGRVENIFVTRSPGPGQHVRLSRESLVRAIGRAGYGEGQFILNSPRFVRVKSEISLLRSGDFVKAAQEFLQEQNLWTRDLRVVNHSYQASQNIPVGKLTFECRLNESDDDPLRNRYNVRVTALVDDVPVENSDITFISQRRSGSVKNISPSADNNSEINIKRGDALRIQFVRKNMVIESAGTAAESGSPGDNIRVTVNNNNTRKTFSARLIDGQTAVVEM